MALGTAYRGSEGEGNALLNFYLPHRQPPPPKEREALKAASLRFKALIIENANEEARVSVQAYFSLRNEVPKRSQALDRGEEDSRN